MGDDSRRTTIGLFLLFSFGALECVIVRVVVWIRIVRSLSILRLTLRVSILNLFPLQCSVARLEPPSLTPSSVRNSQTYLNEAEMFWTHHGALVNDSYQYRYKVHSAKQCPLNDG